MNIIDFHSHILPYADHGCKNPDELKEQLRFANNNHISTIIASSHFYPDRDTIDSFIERREVGLSYAQKESALHGIALLSGAETHWCRHIEKMEGLEELFINNRVLLLELPFHDFDVEDVHTTAASLHARGIDTLLAHVERYPTEKILELSEDYIHYQINAYSFFKLGSRHAVKQYINSGKVAALGSDIHGTTDTYKYFSKVSSRSQKVFEEIMNKSADLLGESVLRQPLL